MKKIIVSIAAIVVAVTVQAGPAAKYIQPPAITDMGNWQVSAYGGGSFQQSGINKDALKRSPRVGVNAGMKLGYDFAPQDWVRPVLEIDVQYNNFNRVNRDREESVDYKLNFRSLALMLNSLVKFNAGDWQPYFGLGVGWFTMHGKEEMDAGDGELVSLYRGYTNGFAWQLLAGTDYILAANWALFAEYKWLNYQIPSSRNFMGEDTNAVKSRIGQQLLNLGVRYSF